MHGGGGGSHGGGFGGGHFGGGGFSGGHVGGFGRTGMASPGAFGGRAAVFQGDRFAGNRFAFRNRFHDRFFRNRFAFFGAGFPYGYYNYYDDCYGRVWTRWGWRWQYTCY
jgi:hypothetical protein